MCFVGNCVRFVLLPLEFNAFSKISVNQCVQYTSFLIIQKLIGFQPPEISLFISFSQQSNKMLHQIFISFSFTHFLVKFNLTEKKFPKAYTHPYEVLIYTHLKLSSTLFSYISSVLVGFGQGSAHFSPLLTWIIRLKSPLISNACNISEGIF